MKNSLLLIVIIISIFSCQKEVKPSYVIFNGFIENSNTNSAKISGNGFDKLIEITDNGSFSDTLKIDKEGYYSLRIGRESTSIYLIKGENIRLTLNAKEFDESLVYSGDIAAENNYLAAKYLLSEKELPFDKVYSLPEDEFIIELNKINASYIDLLNSSKEMSIKKGISIENAINHKVKVFIKYSKSKNDAAAWKIRGKNAVNKIL